MKILTTFIYAYKKQLLIISIILSLIYFTIFYPFITFIVFMIDLLGLLCIYLINMLVVFIKKWYIISRLGLSLNQAVLNGLDTPEKYISYLKLNEIYNVFGRKYRLCISKRVYGLMYSTLCDLCKKSGADCAYFLNRLRYTFIY